MYLINKIKDLKKNNGDKMKKIISTILIAMFIVSALSLSLFKVMPENFPKIYNSYYLYLFDEK